MLNCESSQDVTEIEITTASTCREWNWTRRMKMRPDQLGKVLTTSKVGTKDGDCFILGTLSGSKRTAANIEMMYCAGKDFDSGDRFADGVAAAERVGAQCWVYTTHSNKKTETEVNLEAWDKFLKSRPGATVSEFLREHHGLRPWVVEGAEFIGDEIAAPDGRRTRIARHQPCEKFRLVWPLAKPWRRSDYSTLAEAKASWKAIHAGLTQALGLEDDPTGWELARLFYPPRRPAEDSPFECRGLPGPGLDVASLPVVEVKVETEVEPEFTPSGEASDYQRAEAQRILTLACARIAESAPGQQHSTRLREARLVGGYLWALDPNEAVEALQSAVIESGAGDVDAAMRTVKDGLRYGQAKLLPIEDELSPAERHAAAIEAFKEILEQIEAEGAKETGPDDSLVKLTKDRLRAGRFLDAAPPPLKFIVDGVPENAVAILGGPEASLKTAFAVSLGLAVATGLPLTKGILEPMTQGPVLFIVAEDSEAVVHNKLHALFEAQRAATVGFDDDPALSGWPEYERRFREDVYVMTRADVGGPIHLGLPEKNDVLKATPLFDQILRVSKSIEGLKLVVIDTRSRAWPGEENSNTLAAQVISQAERICDATGAAVVLIHHVSKAALPSPNRRSDNKDSWKAALDTAALRGGVALVNNSRGGIMMAKVPAAVAKRLGHAGDQPLACLRVDKNSYGVEGWEVFMARTEGGGVRHFQPAKGGADPGAVEQAINVVVDDIRQCQQEGRRFTSRELKRDRAAIYKEKLGKATQAVIQSALAEAIHRGLLVEEAGVGGNGHKTKYLTAVEVTA